MKQMSFLSLTQQRKLRCERFLDEMNAIIPWEEVIALIKPYHTENERGRKKRELIYKLKMYFLQQWYALSDPEVEEAVYDRNSFQKFLGIDIMTEAVPDETTICRFRHLLEGNGIQKDIFHLINGKLEEKSLIMKQGTIVDATIIAAPTSTKNASKKRDPEMSSTRKGNEWHFGMKAHVGVDSANGIVHSLECTPAKTHDNVMRESLLHGEERACFGDKGYYDEKTKRLYRKTGMFWGILDRGKRGHALSAGQRKRNSVLQSIRSKVEFPFQVIKCQWNYTKVRYKGIYKNMCHLYMLFACANLYRMRNKLIAEIQATT